MREGWSAALLAGLVRLGARAGYDRFDTAPPTDPDRGDVGAPCGAARWPDWLHRIGCTGSACRARHDVIDACIPTQNPFDLFSPTRAGAAAGGACAPGSIS
ncbi:MAG TPA: hypothetical protein DIU07_03895, partial [Rhodobacteraceae bacterium]|nr:hypothetical protein [Paracoccaceae bacterium]